MANLSTSNVHMKSHKAYLFQNKWMYSSLAKITKDVKTLNIKQSGCFKKSKHCFWMQGEIDLWRSNTHILPLQNDKLFFIFVFCIYF